LHSVKKVTLVRIDTDHEKTNGYQKNLGNEECVEKARKKVAALATRIVPEEQTEEEDNVCCVEDTETINALENLQFE
jgi:hypothetical protein